MSLFAVDADQCKRDGVCVAECPLRLIELKEDGSCPTPTKDAEALCITCGHCVTVCPHGALSHGAMSPDQCPPIEKDKLPHADQLVHYLRARRSIRSYKEQVVDREVISRMIDVARFAPSGHNVQPVRWLVIYDGEEVRRLSAVVVTWMRHLIKEKSPFAEMLHMDRTVAAWDAGMDVICRNAPHVIVAHAQENERTAPSACTIALSYLELIAPSFGVGACWAGYFNTAANMWKPMQEALSLPEGHVSFGAMMVGYPKYRYHRIPLRNEPKITWR